MRASLLIVSAALLASCANSHPSARDAETVYLRSGDGLLARNQPRTIPNESRRPPSSVPPTAKENSVVTHAIAPASVSTTTVDEPLPARRAQLLRRVEDLSNEEADSICLTMQLIPREQVFDHGIRPKKILLRYTNQASSVAELDFLERTLNDPRR